MATLTVRNVDPEVHRLLRRQAAEHGRSVEAEVRAVITESVQSIERSPAEIAESIHAIFAEIGGVELHLPEREPLGPPPELE